MAGAETPTRREITIVGRPGGGAGGANGGVCFYDGGYEIRVGPGDVVDAPMRVAASLVADGLAVATEPDPDPEPDPEVDDLDDEEND